MSLRYIALHNRLVWTLSKTVENSPFYVQKKSERNTVRVSVHKKTGHFVVKRCKEKWSAIGVRENVSSQKSSVERKN